MPRMPEFAGELAPEVFQMHSADYRQPADVPAGDGARRRRRQHRLPDRRGALGDAPGPSRRRRSPAAASAEAPRPRPLLVARDDRLLATTVDSRLGKKLRRSRHADRLEPARRSRRRGSRPRPRGPAPPGATVSFADGSELSVDAVIWATGFRLDHSWIDPPVADAEGRSSPARSHRRPGPLLPRTALAAHARVGAARLGQGRRRVHRRRRSQPPPPSHPALPTPTARSRSERRRRHHKEV